MLLELSAEPISESRPWKEEALLEVLDEVLVLSVLLEDALVELSRLVSES